MRAATNKYSAKVITDESGNITNCSEIAGHPFPDPETGLEIAYNVDYNNHGDSAHYRRFGSSINPKQRTERTSDEELWELYFVNRTELDPRPALVKNPKGYRRGMFMHMHKPVEFINTRMYTLRHIDPKKDDVTYLWYSQFRRIRRLSTARRTDSIDGTDLIYDDEYFWDGQISRNTYIYKGKKELLCARHQNMKKTTRQPGQAIVNGLTLERCKTLMVEAVNKDPNYLYGKRTWYVDPESYLIMWTEIYDKAGQFWKCYMQNTNTLKTATGDEKQFIVGSQFLDFQRTHAGLSNQQSHFGPPEISVDVDPKIFTISNLQKKD